MGNAVLAHGYGQFSENSWACVSRKPSGEPLPKVEHWFLDMSKEDQVSSLVSRIKSWGPDRIFYFPGGGPYGSFCKARWSAQKWALQVTLLTPMALAHALLQPSCGFSVKQLVFIGSQVADQAADPKGVSYGVAKQGLRGFVQSLNGAEYDRMDFRLFRPGYMDTPMIPKNSPFRKDPSQILADPNKLAHVFWQWVMNPTGDKVFTC